MNKTLWVPLPRYIFRKKNVIQEVKRLKTWKDFIDIGCGAGDMACTLASIGYKGTGYDFSKEAIAMANSIKKSRGLAGKVAFALSTKSPNQLGAKADTVFCLEVLEHIKDDKKFFEQLLSITNKYLVISVPAKRSLYSASDEIAGHYRRYDRQDLLELINRKGVKTLKVISYDYPFTNIIRLLREATAKRQKVTKAKPEEKSKQSGIHIFKVGGFIKRLPLEALITPFYWISLVFNGTDLSEGYLVILEKVKLNK